jgi:hypothetical protein
MLEIIKNIKNLSWEDLFDQSTEDITTYQWAISELIEPEEDYEQDYLLIIVLSSRIRSRLALEMMTPDMPSEYFIYKEKLENIYSKAESLLNEYISKYSKNITQITDKKFIPRLNEIKRILLKVRTISQDGDLLEDYEWIKDDLREAAQEFLLLYSDMSLVKDAFSEDPLRSLDTSVFHSKFRDVEQQFKKYFGYFATVEDIFISAKSREYFSDKWWLTCLPDENDIPDPEISEKFMNALQKTFQEAGTKKMVECPESEKVLSYALYNLEPDDNKKMEEHILSCRFCFDWVMDMSELIKLTDPRK